MEFDETPRFCYSHVALDAWPTLPFAPIKTYSPISVNLKEKLELLSLKFFFSLLSRTLSISSFLFLLTFLFFFLSFFLSFFDIWLILCHVSISHLVRFFPEKIYFFSVQFILNKLSSSHFLTFEIFVKISSLKSLTTYHLENCKNIPTVS